MFQIGEFSRLTQVSVRMLRYYDENGILRPAFIDPVTGYRSYRAEQVDQALRITYLRDMGYRISEIGLALENWNTEFLYEQLEGKQRELQERVREEERKLLQLQDTLQALERQEELQFQVAVRGIPAYQVISLRRRLPDYFHEGQLWKELGEYMKQQKIALVPNWESFAVYHDEDYREEDVDVEVCTRVNRLGESCGEIQYRVTEEVPRMACAMVHGPYENISGGFRALAHWLEEHPRYQMAGQSRQICHKGPWNEEHPDSYLTEIQQVIRLREEQEQKGVL